MTYRAEIDDWDRGDAPPITPPDPQRGVCPTCGMWAKLPQAAVNEDTMHAAQVASLRRAGE